MGFISDLLGGKKAPAPPPALHDAATGAMDIARGQQGWYDSANSQARNYLNNVLPGVQRRVVADMQHAYDQNEELSPFYYELGEDGRNLVLRTYDEVAAAGGAARQNEESRRARSATYSAIQDGLAANRAMQARRGVLGGHADSPHIAALAAAQAGAAGNNARLMERNRGEQMRLGFLPQAQAAVGASPAHALRQAQLQEGIGQAKAMTPQAYLQYGAGTGQLGNTAAAGFSRGSDLASTAYNADLEKARMDNARQAQIWNTIGKIGGTALAAFGGGPMAAASALTGQDLSGFGGGGAPAGAGGGGGGGGGYSAASFGRHNMPISSSQPIFPLSAGGFGM